MRGFLIFASCSSHFHFLNFLISNRPRYAASSFKIQTNYNEFIEMEGGTGVLRECFTYNAKRIILEEIALEGLEGITLDLLWRRVEYRTNFPISGKMKTRFWAYILNHKEISLYQLPEPLPHVEVIDRFTIVDEDTGNLKNPDTFLDGPYEYHPAMNEFGSCKHFTTRKAIPSTQFTDAPYEKVLALYGNTLVMVASREERWNALAVHMPITYLYQLTQIQYCILELIGKGRDNGQMTTGTTNLTKIIKEPKNLFYNRKLLKDLGLIRVLYITQNLANRGIKSLLLRLTRFHKPTILSMPKAGKMYNLVQYLKAQPGYCERTDLMWKNRMLTCSQTKRLKKTLNVFEFEEKTVKLDELPRTQSKSSTPSLYRKRKIIRLSPPSDDEFSQSDDDTNEAPPIKCQYKVGVGLLRQAYERFLDGGLKGLSQLELAEVLGVEFYTGRTICRIFKAKKIVREYFEDRGKQRVIRYVAIAAGSSDLKYMKEAQTFLEHTKQREPTQADGDVEMADANNEESNKHILEINEDVNDNKPDRVSLLKTKTLTLRQLRFANGILKIVKERQCVTGYQTLSNLVSIEINEPPMVTKGLKLFIQKIAAGGHLKVYKVRWPGVGNEHNFSNLICAPHINKSHPIVRAKYKEVYLRATAKKRPSTAVPTENSCRPLSMFVNPRYMKIQCLHEFIIKMVYFDPPTTDLKPGFMSVSELMPTMTVKFAISNMSVNGMSDISDLRIQESHLNLKLKDTPPEISHFIIKSKSLRNAIRMNLKVLAMHGLIQLIYQPHVQTADYANSQLTSFLFYVNRNARIVNTTGQWPRNNANLKSLERAYYFETFDDVKSYWNDVYEISVATKITTTNRTKKNIHPPVRQEEQIKMYDNGDRYGDGGGPCGFDSCFYMEIQRLWQTFYVRTLKPRAIPKNKDKPSIVIPKLAKSRKPRTPRKKKIVPKVNPVMKLKARQKSRKRQADETVVWSKKEDYVITMCHAAITIASPSSQPGSLKVRNLVAKDILSRNDPKKTQSTCHRRALVIQLNPTMVHEKDSLLNEMRRRRHLIQKYEGMIKKLRLRYSTNMSKFINESRIPMLELVWLIWQVSMSESYTRRLPCVAINAEDFHESYSIVPATANKLYNLYRTPELGPLREGVFVTIMMTYNNELKSDLAKKVYSIFKVYPENSLRIVVDQLRKCGAVSAKEKIFNNQMHRLHLEDVVQSAYKVSANYQRRWIGRLNSEFVDSLGRAIENGLPESEFKGSAEINCLVSELQALNILQIKSATLPEILGASENTQDEQANVIDIETKFKLKSGTVEWLSTTPRETSRNVAHLYENIEYESVIESLKKNAVLYIKENLNETYNQKDSIIMLLLGKGEQGLSFRELQKSTSYDTQSLITRLSQLESLNVVKRVGLYNNTIIHAKFINNYAVKIDNRYAIITPWMTMDFDIRYDVFLEWAGVIMNKIFEFPGVSVPNLADYFELITMRAVQDICMFLQQTKCITLRTLKVSEQDLFSDEDIPPEFSDFNPYESPDAMVAFPIKDSLTRYSYLRKTMMEKTAEAKI